MGNSYIYHHNRRFETSQKRRGMKPTHKALLIWHVLAVWYYLTSSFCEGENTYSPVDLTHLFDKNTIYWVTEPSLVLNVTYKGNLPGQDVWYQKDEMYAATHGGTHMDAPCHFAKDRWCISDIPLEHLIVPAAVVDISHLVSGNPDVHLTKDMLLQWESVNERIPDKSLLLIYTGWSQFWPDRLKYAGTLEKNTSLLKFPSIKKEVAEWLVSNRSIVGIGIDTMSIDIPKERPGTHVTLMENNIYGLENVNNLHKLPATGATIYVMPMKLEGASGAPCRIVSQVPRHAFLAVGTLSLPSMLIIAIVSIFVIYLQRM